MLYQIIEAAYKDTRFNAGSKARDDAYRILTQYGAAGIEMAPHDDSRASAGKLGKLLGHVKAGFAWKKCLTRLGSGDVVFIQLPIINHTIFLDKAFGAAKKRGVKVIALVHDLEELRYELGSDNEAERLRYKTEGEAQRRLADIIIVHNEAMKKYLIDEKNVPEQSLIVLGIFDYLLDDTLKMADAEANVVTIAGNLSKEKVGYIYRLPRDVRFNLYGKGYAPENGTDNLKYCGAFAPDEPDVLSGAYGLVWDGERSDTCGGFHGQYLKYNAPHKTSLYLSCGMPVIIWSEAAMADFVTGSGAGITVSDLRELSDAISAVSSEQYRQMRASAEAISHKLRSGHYLRSAVDKALSRLEAEDDA